ncbi:MAG: SDR family NAD(P)-dependent oxidoreductase [Gammaproteobacteria bacterium]|nr:SDR family NAD(P)-dependent oxidoreductase [Gammaproteobacteria bacterium]
MAGRLEGKVAIIVGAGQTPGEGLGNGRATAMRFADEGARLLLADRDSTSVAATLDMVEQRGAEARVFHVDVTRETDCAAMIEAAREHFGRIDVLHNNVGIGRGDRGPANLTEEIWDDILDTNVKSVMFTCKHVLPVMREQGSGCITNISSVAAVCSVGIVAYKTSKAAVNAYTQSLAIGNAKYGIRANVIMPGLMETPMAIEGNVAAGRDRAEVMETRNRQVPLKGGMGSAWDVANAALFLASDEAGFITGVCLAVDGGQSARIG